MDISSMLNVLDRIESREIMVHRNRCVRMRHRNATCERCADACTSGAISVDAGNLEVYPDKCVGCGTCTTACLTGALEAFYPHDSELLKMSVEATKAAGGETVFACIPALEVLRGSYDEDCLVGIKCLGRIEESLMTTLVAKGAQRLWFVHGNCAECPRATGWETAKSVADCEQVLLDAWGSMAEVVVTGKIPACAALVEDKGYDPGRRGFFSSIKDEAKRTASLVIDEELRDTLGEKTAAEPIIEHVDEDTGYLPRHRSGRRDLLLGALDRIGDPVEDLIETRLFGHVIIDVQKCSGCRMCVMFCSTGALWNYEREDGSKGIGFYPGYCVKCKLCRDICPKQAIEISEEIIASDVATNRADRYEVVCNMPGVGGSDGNSILDRFKSLTKAKYVVDLSD